jgi:hypothetical protein|tara:strand:+ start:604 stop:810 length:207 start_codon:yes stop_codon:yes gene_type:complete
MDDQKLNRIIEIIRDLNEEGMVPTNNVGQGKIAGTVEAGDDPPVRKPRKRYIYQKGLRKTWSPTDGRK